MRVVDFEGSREEWDRAVARLEGSTFCHLFGWRAVMEDVLGHRCHYRTVVDDADEIVGLLPLVRVRSRLFGDYLVSMPFLSYGGPLGSDQARALLIESAVELARDLGVDLLELRAREALAGDVLSISNRKITVLKTLPATSEELWEDGLRAKVRSQVRRPMKEGVEVAFGSHLLDPYYHVFSRTMRDLGTPVLPKDFFRVVLEQLPTEVVLGVAELDGEPVAAGCGFVWQGELEITWAGALREHSRASPNMLLYWSFMEEGIRRGADTFNFGRCTPGSGTHRFKKQWGSEDHPLPWAQYSSTGTVATPNPDSPKFRMATSAWSRLPMSVANLVGPYLSRSLP